ncbi:MAG: rubrerythrin family protein [Planctomycetaceae bacterium]|jgi:rubrerythrin|nr:rubrerythrin family protein [Planctomycetaceae bacterium]
MKQTLQSDSSRREFLQCSAKTAAVSMLFFESPFTFAGQTDSSTQPDKRKSIMSKIKGTQTEKNLLKAFAGESQARNRYTFFSAKASEEGYEHIAHIFLETAEQEKVHALQFFKYLDVGEALEITASFPAGSILTTEKNLEASAAGEYEEWAVLYPEFAKIAKEEGFTDVSRTFTAICVSEKQHERRYRGFLEHLKTGDLFKREGVIWRCRYCGFISNTTSAPSICPACKMPQSWFEILAENW